MNWETLVVLHAVPTLLMAGLIWLVQLVHYPLFALIDPASFSAYEREHCRRISWLVGPLMLAEALLAAALCLQAPAQAAAWTWAGGALLVGIFAATFFVQVPCHEKLAKRADPMVIRRLVRSNWLRTFGWSLRGALAIGLLLVG